MGSCVSVQYKTVGVKDGVQGEFIKCVPSYRYRRFPQAMKKPAFSLLQEKLAVSEQIYQSIHEYEDVLVDYSLDFWRTDAQFLPNNDTAVFVAGKPEGREMPFKLFSGPPICSTIPPATIIAISLDKDVNDGHVFEITNADMYSKLQTHPSGRWIGYVSIWLPYDLGGVGVRNTSGISFISITDPFIFKGKQELKPSEIGGMTRNIIIPRKHEGFIEVSPKGFRCRCIAFAPNGKLTAKIYARRFLISSPSPITEVVLSVVQKGHRSTVRTIKLHQMYLRYFRNDQVIESKWTQDSSNIAVCFGVCLLIFSKGLEQLFDISEVLQYTLEHYMSSYLWVQVEKYMMTTKDEQQIQNIITDNNIFTFDTCKFDFDPRSCHELLAFGTIDRRVCFINSRTKLIDAETDQLSTCPTDYIDCLQYHPFGKYVAVGTRSLIIYLLDSSDGTALHSFDMTTESPGLHSSLNYQPSIMRICFSNTGEQLVTATRDAKVRVYQMPDEMLLFDKCKWAILSIVPQTKLKKLPLPKPIINKLLAIPFLK